MEVIDFNVEMEDDNIEDAIEEIEIKTGGSQKPPVQKKKDAITREIVSWISTFAIAIIAALVLKNFVIINATVPTGSMENTIIPGDRLIGNRLAYRYKEPQRGDIIIFKFPDDEEELFVKRVIGLPGETVDIVNAKVYINGSQEALKETYLKEKWTEAVGPYHFEIPEDSYLMLGDNRNNSLDARYWTNTYVSEDKILGKAEVVYWPLADIGRLE